MFGIFMDTPAQFQPVTLPQQLKLDDMESFITTNGDIYSAQWGEIKLSSRFQPIYSLAHQRIVGFEGLVRANLASEEMLSPLSLFSMVRNEQETVFQDRLCRTLHIKNFMAQSDDASWLFLNINPLVTVCGKQYGAFFSDLLQRYNMPPERIVVEILEGQIDDEQVLAEAIRYYKDIGCLIAIDDFGAGHSNFERIWSIKPEIVKLDRSIIVQAADNKAVRRVVPSLVSLIHEAGSLVLIEGIETEEQALIAMHSDVDFVQGYYFSRPEERLPGFVYHPAIGDLFNTFKENNLSTRLEHKRALKEHVEVFRGFAQRIAAGIDPILASNSFLSLSGVVRCYLLNEEGIQLGENLNPFPVSVSDPRFEPLSDATNAIWIRRHYFQKAMQEPDVVQISNPYLSITGGSMCVTLSIALTHIDGALVLCGDIKWSD